MNKLKDKKECCGNPKNWEDYAVFSSDELMGTVGYRCKKCDATHSMGYGRYLSIMRKTYPNQLILP